MRARFSTRSSRVIGSTRTVSSRIDEGSPFASAGLQSDDWLIEVDGEPFFEGRGLQPLYEWLLRELTATPRDYPLLVRRNGRDLTLTATLQLAPLEER